MQFHVLHGRRVTTAMPFTTAIVGSVLVYIWLFEGRVSRSLVYVPSAIVVMLTITYNMRHGGWGFSTRALAPGLWRALAITVPPALLFVAAGAAIGTLHDRRDFLGSLAKLFVWGGAQQWVLQTVVLREAQQATSRAQGIVVAGLLFGAIHLPNPFLSLVTAFAGVVWCWIYDRYPNIIPIALSHALGTLAILYAFDERITGRLRIGMSYLRLDF